MRAHFMSPLCASTTCSSWMRSRFSASATSRSSASAAHADEREGLQQVVLAEVLARRDELLLVLCALLGSSLRHAGSTARNVYLTKRGAARAGRFAGSLIALHRLQLDARSTG